MPEEKNEWIKKQWYICTWYKVSRKFWRVKLGQKRDYHDTVFKIWGSEGSESKSGREKKREMKTICFIVRKMGRGEGNW